MLLALLVALVAGQDPQPAPVAAAPKPTGFAEVAAAHFADWDRDRDGVLQPVEIDRLCVDPARRGEEAAAIAALKRVVRSGRYAVPTLTREVLAAVPTRAEARNRPTAAAEERAAVRAAEEADRRDAGEAGAPTGSAAAPDEAPKPAGQRQPNFAASYQSSLRRIRTSKRELFLDPTPDLDACRQGPLGDCFFVAVVGAFAHRDPEALKRLVQPTPDGYRVVFGGGRAIDVAPLTDAEIALSGTTGDEGLWLPVLEKAMGNLRQQQDPKKYAAATATDAISKGGSVAKAIQLLTGHATTRLALKKRPASTEKDANGVPIPKPTAPAASYDALETEVRTQVVAALAARRLVTCSTVLEPQPRGIPQKHAFAVLGYDAATDELQLWNPHGNTFTPKGQKGLQHGYPTKAGRFSMPVADFVRVFSSCAIETDEPLSPPSPEALAPASGTGGK